MTAPRFPMSFPTFRSVSATFAPVPSIRPLAMRPLVMRARATSTVLPSGIRERWEQGRLLHEDVGHHLVQGR